MQRTSDVSFRIGKRGQLLLAVVVVVFVLLKAFPIQDWVSGLANVITIVSFYYVVNQDQAPGDTGPSPDPEPQDPESSPAPDVSPRVEVDEGPATGWRPATEPAVGSSFHSVWAREDATRSLPFHHYCSLSLFEGAGPDPGGPPSVTICSGAVRWALRHTPLVILVVTALFIVHGEVSPSTAGMAASFVPSAMLTGLVLPIGLVLASTLLLIAFVVSFTPLSRRGIAKAITVYGLVALLSGGAVSHYFMRVSSDSVASAPPVSNFFLYSGYLLALLVGGHLAYDGILRTETMFDRLPQKSPSVIRDLDRYESIRSDLSQSLRAALVDTPQYRLPVAYAFAGLWVLPGLMARLDNVWSVTGGRIGLRFLLDVPVVLLLTGLDFVVVVVSFQSLILISFVWRLLYGHGMSSLESNEEPTFGYVPFHPDNHAGFGDFGQFSVRVTSILALVGFHEVYRYWVPTAVDTQLFGSGGLSFLLWAVTYPLPLFVYLVVFVTWVYLSFWQLHRLMKEAKMLRLGHTFAADDATLIERHRIKASGPEWPASRTMMLGLLVVGIVPPVMSGLGILF